MAGRSAISRVRARSSSTRSRWRATLRGAVDRRSRGADLPGSGRTRPAGQVGPGALDGDDPGMGASFPLPGLLHATGVGDDRQHPLEYRRGGIAPRDWEPGRPWHRQHMRFAARTSIRYPGVAARRIGWRAGVFAGAEVVEQHRRFCPRSGVAESRAPKMCGRARTSGLVHACE